MSLTITATLDTFRVPLTDISRLKLEGEFAGMIEDYAYRLTEYRHNLTPEFNLIRENGALTIGAVILGASFDDTVTPDWYGNFDEAVAEFKRIWSMDDRVSVRIDDESEGI